MSDGATGRRCCAIVAGGAPSDEETAALTAVLAVVAAAAAATSRAEIPQPVARQRTAGCPWSAGGWLAHARRSALRRPQ